jgi:hypothetical protein
MAGIRTCRSSVGLPISVAEELPLGNDDLRVHYTLVCKKRASRKRKQNKALPANPVPRLRFSSLPA